MRRQLLSFHRTRIYLAQRSKENLLIAKPTATDDEIIQVIKHAQLNQSYPISSQRVLTLGLESMVFYLSAGERQRLAVARALLKNSPLVYPR